MRRKLKEFCSLNSIYHLVYLPKIIFLFKNWMTFSLSYAGMEKSVSQYKLRNGMVINVADQLDTATIAVIFLKKDYGEPFENSTVIDIGANIGVFSLYAAKAKNTKVYSFEPVPSNITLLKKNVKQNKLENKIKVFPLGLGKKKEKKKIYLSENSPYHSMYTKTSKAISINCISLREAFDMCKINKCNLLKIDCEGAEYDIFYALPDEYYKKIENIRMEYHNIKKNKDIQHLKDFLTRKGFVAEKIRIDNEISGIAWFSRKNPQKLKARAFLFNK